jgi:hypothetical protein
VKIKTGDFYQVRLPITGRWDTWAHLQLIINGDPKIVEVVDCQKIEEALDWLIDNDYYHTLANGKPLYVTHGRLIPEALVSYNGVDQSAWFFSDLNVALLFKLTLGGA